MKTYLKRLIMPLYAAIFCLPATAQTAQLPLPAIPDTLTVPRDRADYMTDHMWDPFDDTPFSEFSQETLEQTFANFISVFPIGSEEGRMSAVKKLMKKVENNRDDYMHMAGIAEKYLYEPESPLASEEYYILFLNEFIDTPILDKASKIRAKWQLETAMKNRPGKKATDFRFLRRDGHKSTLKKEIAALATPNSRLLLIFYDPDCSDCSETIEKIKNNTKINRAISDGSLTIAAIYSGEERDVWKAEAENLPSEWVVGYDDGTLQDKGLYVIRAFPTMYLIGSDGRVLYKEPHLDELIFNL